MKEIERAPSKGERGETEKVRCDGKKKRRDRSGTRDRGNKPDGEFEGDGVNGDRRRMDGEEAGRQAGRAGRQAREARVAHKGDGSGTEERSGRGHRG